MMLRGRFGFSNARETHRNRTPAIWGAGFARRRRAVSVQSFYGSAIFFSFRF